MLAIRLGGWEAKGLRCPDHRVSFETPDGHVSRVSLLQMPNGTGKTTTLKLLRAALGGPPTNGEWSEGEIRALASQSHARSFGQFSVWLLYGPRRVTFTLSFNFDDGYLKRTTTLHTGQREGFQPPPEIRRFLNRDFVDFFVFDGELAAALLDKDHTNADRVVEHLFQLRVLDRIAAWANEHWKDVTDQWAKENGVSARTETGLAKYRRTEEECRARLQFLEARQAELEGRRKTNEAKLRTLEAESEGAIRAKAAFRERLEKADVILEEAKGDVKEATARCLEMIRAPYNVSKVFAIELLELKGALDRVRLPESTAREFFEELALEALCVCARPIDGEARDAIRERAKLYLASDDVAFLNALKSEIAAQVNGHAENHELNLVGAMGQLRAGLDSEATARTYRDQIKEEALGDDPELEQKGRDIERLKAEILKDELDLERFDDPAEGVDVEDLWGLAVLRGRLRDAVDKIKTISRTVSLKRRVDLLTTILLNARIDAQQALARELCVQANERIRELMPHNAIAIRGIDRCLRLIDRGGGSAGETLGVAYGFLATLFQQSDYELPFVVDSPAGALDGAKRRALANLIPRLGGQFVAFTISTERGDFQDELERLMPGGVRYSTLFRKGDEALESAARRCGSVVESSDGILVEGRQFFERFQVREGD